MASTARSFAVPPTQNSAPVLEFRCLYTHDLRRKQKRWQDGFCKYHTFNRRVMAYDVARNFIGDTHWQDSQPLQDGDETTLDRGGVMVQVQDQVGATQTDLAPLFERNRPQEQQKSDLSTAARRTLGGPTGPVTRPTTGPPKHKSLNALLGTPKGLIGRAALQTSPYEKRRAPEVREVDDSRNHKRQRTEGDGSTTIRQPISPVRDIINIQSRPPVFKAPAPQKQKTAAARKIQREVIVVSDHDSEVGHPLGSDVTLPSSPEKRPTATPALKPRRVLTSSFVRTSVPTPQRRPPSSPPVSNKTKVVDVDVELEKPREHVDPINDENRVEREAPKPKAKPLRMAKSRPRMMLICQDQQPKPVQPKALARNRAAEVCSDSETETGIPKSRKTKSKSASKGRSESRQRQTISDIHDTVHVETDTTLEADDNPCESRESSPAFSTMPPRKRRRTTSGDGNLSPLRNEDRTHHDTVPAHSEPRLEADITADPHPPQSSPPNLPSRSLRRVQSDTAAALSFPPDAFSTLPCIDDDITAAAAPARRKSPIKRSISENDGGAGRGKRKRLGMGARAARPLSPPLPPPKPKDTDVGAWSTEALDLFDWRPPDWDERVRLRQAAAAAC